MNLDDVVSASLPASGPLRSYMQWAVKTTDAEHLFHLGAVLPNVANACVESGFVVDSQRRMRPALWTFLVGVPASSKSTAQKRAQGHYKLARNALLGALAADPFIMAEGSVPGLFEALEERFDVETGLSSGVIIRDEAARLLAQRDDSVADMLCNIIDGEEVRRHLRALKAEARSTGEARDVLKSPAFSGCFATTFARLREVTQASHIEGGLFSRFLWFVGQPCLPNPQLHVDLHRDEQKRVIDEWVDWSRWLLAQQLVTTDRLVTIPDEAVELLRAGLFEDFREHARTDSRLNATRKRGLTQATLIAGVYALTQQRLAVTLEDMQAAIALVRMSTEGLQALDPSLAVAPEVADVERVFVAIKQLEGSEGTPKAPLYKALRLPKRDLDQALDMLLAQARIEIRTERSGGKGRPTERLCTVQPTSREPADVIDIGRARRMPQERAGVSLTCSHCSGSGAEPGTDGGAVCTHCWAKSQKP